jgi:hypothetical protein
MARLLPLECQRSNEMLDIAPRPDTSPGVITSCECPRAPRDEAFTPKSDIAWLALAAAAGVVLATAWVSRERAIHRRRRQPSNGEERRE